MRDGVVLRRQVLGQNGHIAQVVPNFVRQRREGLFQRLIEGLCRELDLRGARIRVELVCLCDEGVRLSVLSEMVQNESHLAQCPGIVRRT